LFIFSLLLKNKSMNEITNDEKKEKKVRNSVLFENEAYNKALALKDETISEKNETIRILTEQLGQRDQLISGKDKQIEDERSARIEAQNELAEKKELKVEHKGNYYRTEEERFEDSFLKEWEKLDNNDK